MIRQLALSLLASGFVHTAAVAAGPKPAPGWTVEPAMSVLGERIGTRARVRSVDGAAELLAIRFQNGDYAVALVLKKARPHCPRLCEVRFRFDDEASIAYDAGAASDGLGDTLVFSPAVGLFTYFEKAGRVRIAAPVAGRGTTLFEFNTGPGLNPDPVK